MRIRMSWIALFCLLIFSWAVGSPPEDPYWSLIQEAGMSEDHGGADVVVVFDSTFVDVRESGLSYNDFHVLTKVLTPRGALRLKALTYGYDPLSADVEVKDLRIYRKNGSVETVPLDRVLDMTAPARGIYWGARQKMVAVGRLEPGDAVKVKVFRKGFTYALLDEEDEDARYIPPMRGHFYDIVPFWSDAPVLVKSYIVSMPADKPLQYKFYHSEVACELWFEGDRHVYRWTKKDIEPFRREPNMVSHWDVAPKLLVSTAPDWESKSSWFYGVNEDYGSFEVTPEIQAKVDALVRDCRTDMERISVLTHWVAEEIRYSGLTMGPGEGYTLHKGAMDFRDRCGVCKDKAGMLITMLRAAGYYAVPTMTMAGSRIDPIPADHFNHCVVALKKDDGSFMLLDPTWVPGVRELWSSAEQQQNYLIGDPEGIGLRETPVSPAENHYFRVRGQSKLLADGTLEGSFSVEAEGQTDARLRRGFTRGRKTRWASTLAAWVHDLSPLTEVLDVSHGDPYDLSKPMHITVRYRIPRYAVVGSSEIFFTPLLARHVLSDRGTNYYLYMNLDLGERQYGFRTRCSKLMDFRETVVLPRGYTVRELPVFERTDGSWASFSGGYNVEGNRLVFEERCALKKRVYEPSDYPSFVDAVRGVKRAQEEPVVLKKR